jgi:hypothetical protein
VTDLTVLQIWTLLLNGRLRILAFPTKRFSFRIYGTEKYKFIATRCQQTEPILLRQRILLTVKNFLSNQIVATEYTTVREGVLYPVREICLKGINLDSQKAGSNTSTVTLRVVGGNEKGNLKSETVNYGRKSQGTRTRERLRCQGPAAHKKDRPVLSSERAPHGIKNVTVRRIPYSVRK